MQHCSIFFAFICPQSNQARLSHLHIHSYKPTLTFLFTSFHQLLQKQSLILLIWNFLWRPCTLHLAPWPRIFPPVKRCRLFDFTLFSHLFRVDLQRISHRLDRVLGFFSSRQNWDTPHPPHPQASVSLPLVPGGRAHSITRDGGGGPNSDEGTGTVWD